MVAPLVLHLASVISGSLWAITLYWCVPDKNCSISQRGLQINWSWQSVLSYTVLWQAPQRGDWVEGGDRHECLLQGRGEDRLVERPENFECGLLACCMRRSDLSRHFLTDRRFHFWQIVSHYTSRNVFYFINAQHSWGGLNTGSRYSLCWLAHNAVTIQTERVQCSKYCNLLGQFNTKTSHNKPHFCLNISSKCLYPE